MKIEETITFENPDKQSDTDKLNKIISYILFLRRIFAIIIISTIFNVATKTLVERSMLLFCFSKLVAPQGLFTLWIGIPFVVILEDDEKFDPKYMSSSNCYHFSYIYSKTYGFLENYDKVRFVSLAL